MILAVMGGSCSGKTQFALKCVEYGFDRVITNTTRPKRVDDKEDSYHFLTLEEFKKRVRSGDIFEYAKYNGNYYGSSIEALTPNCVIVLEPNGYKALKNKFPDSTLGIMLDVSDEERLRRGLLRGDSEEIIKERIEEDKKLFNKDFIEDVEYVFKDLTLEDNAKVIEEFLSDFLTVY